MVVHSGGTCIFVGGVQTCDAADGGRLVCVVADDALDGAELLVPQDGNSSTADADKSKKRKRSADRNPDMPI